MKYTLSARNQFEGKVIDINEGAVNGIVNIELPGGNVIRASISMASIRVLDLKVGDTAGAVMKATDVMVGK